MNSLNDILNLGNLVSGAIGAFISWLLVQQKMMREIAKLRNETIEIEVNLRKELFTLQENYKETVKTLIDKIYKLDCNAPSKQVEKQLEEIKKFFLLDFFNSFAKLLDLTQIIIRIRNDRTEIQDFIEDELFPFLNLIYKVLEIINSPDCTAAHGIKPLKISKSTYAFVLKFIKRNLRFWQFDKRKQLKQLEYQLNQFTSN